MKNITIQISTDRQKELIDFYTTKLKALQKEVSEVQDLIRELKGGRPINQQSQTNSSSNTSEYNLSWTVVKKIQFALIKNNSCMTARQIVDFLANFEKEKKKNFYGTISGTISNKIKNELFFNRYEEFEGGDYYIGLKEWFDNDGNVSEQYKAK
ncbi:MAG: hypothetical protein PVF73_08445 [Bacteroidales bacterium]|jgi:hypothetical protein